MSDFIREVDEEYRRDRVMQLLSRYQVLIALVVVAIIAGAGGYRFWADRQVTTAEKLNDRFLAAAELAKGGKAQDAEAAFEALAKDAPAGYAMLARMRAAESLAGHDAEGAAKAFDALANDDAVPASMRDAARLRGAMIRIDTLDPKAFESRYGRFSESGLAFAGSMRELLALAALKRQDSSAAERFLNEIVIDPNAPAALRGRAQAFLLLVRGGPAQPSAAQPPPLATKVIGGAPPVAPKPASPKPAPTSTPPAASTPATPSSSPPPAAAQPTAPAAPEAKPAAPAAPTSPGPGDAR